MFMYMCMYMFMYMVMYIFMYMFMYIFMYMLMFILTDTHSLLILTHSMAQVGKDAR